MKGIKYISEARPTGYGQAARRYMRALRRAGVPLTWTPMVEGRSWGFHLEPFLGRDFDDPELGDLCNAPIDYDVVVVHLVPDFYPAWRVHQGDGKMVGMTVWETDHLPPHWKTGLEAVDALVVPCAWNRDVFRAAGVGKPLAVVPHLFEARAAEPLIHLAGIDDGDFVFYTIGAWSDRKGGYNTLQSYLDAFDADDPVALVIKTGDSNERRSRHGTWWHYVGRFLETPEREIRRIRRRHSRPPRVVTITEQQSDRAMRGLHARGDCYVSLTRGEGWGLGAYDAASIGKPVIITRHGGQLEYLPEDRAHLVDCTLVPANPTGAFEQRFYGPPQVWAEPDLRHGSHLMRHVFENREEARARGLELRAFIRERFTEADILRDLLAFLDAR